MQRSEMNNHILLRLLGGLQLVDAWMQFIGIYIGQWWARQHICNAAADRRGVVSWVKHSRHQMLFMGSRKFLDFFFACFFSTKYTSLINLTVSIEMLFGAVNIYVVKSTLIYQVGLSDLIKNRNTVMSFFNEWYAFNF